MRKQNRINQIRTLMMRDIVAHNKVHTIENLSQKSNEYLLANTHPLYRKDYAKMLEYVESKD